ncbi:MAG: elongation factor P--(R)-beta-lysine ligase [Pirellula staleyi]
MRNGFQTQAPVKNLKRRADLLRTLRRFFDERGFTEVQTPVLSRNTIIDRHLDPLELVMELPGELATTWYLQTSPEQSMKRLLSMGIGSIYQVGPVFRGGELGKNHNPEFTMAEWYDVAATFEDGLTLLDELLRALLGTSPSERIRFDEAFRIATGLDLFSSSAIDLGRWSVEQNLVETETWSSDWDDWVNLIFSERVQGTLGLDRPVLVTHFPASQAALARVCDEDTRTAERYEAFFQGVELANGYHELLDADQLLARSVIANRQRMEDGKGALPLENPLFDAMRAGMPNACGCALGFDRVVMLACEAGSLDEVIAFTAENA